MADTNNNTGKFTDINITDEIRKENPHWEEEFEFHLKNSYVNIKENKNKKPSNKILITNHYKDNE